MFFCSLFDRRRHQFVGRTCQTVPIKMRYVSLEQAVCPPIASEFMVMLPPENQHSVMNDLQLVCSLHLADKDDIFPYLSQGYFTYDLAKVIDLKPEKHMAKYEQTTMKLIKGTPRYLLDPQHRAIWQNDKLVTIELKKYNPFYERDDPFALLRDVLPIGALVSPEDRVPGLLNKESNSLSPSILDTQVDIHDQSFLFCGALQVRAFDEDALIKNLEKRYEKARVKARYLQVHVRNGWHSIEKHESQLIPSTQHQQVFESPTKIKLEKVLLTPLVVLRFKAFWELTLDSADGRCEDLKVKVLDQIVVPEQT